MKVNGGQSDYEKQWAKAVAEWKNSHPPDFAGYWYCVIGGAALTDGQQDSLGGLQFNLGHDISRSRDPGSRLDTTRHRPICPKHNREQGSLSFAEYRAKKPSLRCGF